MPDHVHLFVGFDPAAPSLSEGVKGLKAVIARHLKSRQIPGPYWQKGFFDHVMRSPESYGQKWLYVRENPVRAGLVRMGSDWPYQGEIHPVRLWYVRAVVAMSPGSSEAGGDTGATAVAVRRSSLPTSDSASSPALKDFGLGRPEHDASAVRWNMRNSYLICYDMSDEKRLRKVFKAMPSAWRL
jgi:hypothetical protein